MNAAMLVSLLEVGTMTLLLLELVKKGTLLVKKVALLEGAGVVLGTEKHGQRRRQEE